jgi:hypothetical protein
MRRLPVFALLLLFQLVACTDAGLYAAGAGGPSGPDRAELKGRACVPLAAGEAFPVKVLFALQGGAGMDRGVVGSLVDALNATTSQFSSNYISFSVVGFHTVASGFLGSFARDERVAQAFATYGSYSMEAGPVSLRAPIRLAQSIISGDMQTGCRGQVARTRYYVVLVITTADTSCANPVFNAGIDLKCNAFAQNVRSECADCQATGNNCGVCDTGRGQCSECELARVTQELRALANKYNAGEVTVQPLYVYSGTPDPLVVYQATAIARAGGTELLSVTPENLDKRLASLNYASLQRELKLKRFVAMNINTRSRDGQVLTDSDGDGLPDAQEEEIGTDPAVVDSDQDGLGDGVEVRMGLKPQGGDPANFDIVTGCNAKEDTDGDRLNDCEERVLGTDACIADHDGDGLPDLVEFLGGSNPLIAEDLQDDDQDGLSNVGEILAHTDPISADIAFQQERGYGYSIVEVPPGPVRTADDLTCYDINVYNVTVVGTLARPAPDGSGLTIVKGTNDLYMYLQVGRDNDPRGSGIGSLFVPSVKFTPPATRKPRGVIAFTPDDFVSGL